MLTNFQIKILPELQKKQNKHNEKFTNKKNELKKKKTKEKNNYVANRCRSVDTDLLLVNRIHRGKMVLYVKS